MKNSVRVIFVVLVGMLFSLSLVSALDLGNFFGKITGHTLETGSWTCADTDGGKDEFTSGTVTYTYNEKELVGQDYCFNKFIFYKNSKVLREYFCDQNDQKASKSYDCVNGCSEDACIVSSENSTEEVPAPPRAAPRLPPIIRTTPRTTPQFNSANAKFGRVTNFVRQRCVSNCGCAASIPVGQTCSNGCGGTCAGTYVAPVPSGSDETPFGGWIEEP